MQPIEILHQLLHEGVAVGALRSLAAPALITSQMLVEEIVLILMMSTSISIVLAIIVRIGVVPFHHSWHIWGQLPLHHFERIHALNVYDVLLPYVFRELEFSLIKVHKLYKARELREEVIIESCLGKIVPIHAVLEVVRRARLFIYFYFSHLSAFSCNRIRISAATSVS